MTAISAGVTISGNVIKPHSDYKSARSQKKSRYLPDTQVDGTIVVAQLETRQPKQSRAIKKTPVET